MELKAVRIFAFNEKMQLNRIGQNWLEFLAFQSSPVPRKPVHGGSIYEMIAVLQARIDVRIFVVGDKNRTGTGMLIDFVAHDCALRILFPVEQPARIFARIQLAREEAVAAAIVLAIDQQTRRDDVVDVGSETHFGVRVLRSVGPVERGKLAPESVLIAHALHDWFRAIFLSRGLYKP